MLDFKMYLNLPINFGLLFISLCLLLTSCSTIEEKLSEVTQKSRQKTQPAQLISNFDQTTLIANFTLTEKPFALANVYSNASGITWDPYNQQYFVIQNNAATIFRYNNHFEYLGKLEKSGNINSDTEGLTYLDGDSLMIVTEANIAYKVEIDNNIFNRGRYNASASIQLDFRPKIKNKGFEAIAFRPESPTRSAKIYAGNEGSRKSKAAKMKVVYFDLSLANELQQYEPESKNIVEPFDAEIKFHGIITDIAGMTFDPTGTFLIIVSQELSKAIQVIPETGEVVSQLMLHGAPIYEGITIGPNGELVLVSEKNLAQVYRQPQN